ncbi:MAG: TolC family protein [Terriglobia bacterium]|jgi:cobalt-zinc-cadmium efflux system outer membrane protein
MMNHNSKRSTAKHPGVLSAAIFLLGWAAGNISASAQQAPPLGRIDLEQAIQLAIKHNHALKAAENTIQQSEAEETTAAIRPNPVFTYDDLYVPIFSPGQLNTSTLDNITEFDLGFTYTFERGHKRQARINAAKDATAVTRSQVKDNERSLTYNVAQQFVNVLLAKADLDFANQDLASFQQTVDLSTHQQKAGAISEGDLLKIKLQMLQFQTDVSAAKLALVQSRLSLRELLGFESVPADYDVIGDLAYAPLRGNQEDLQSLALKQRPDLLAAQLGVAASQSQYQLAKANRSRSLSTTFDYTHVSALNTAGFTVNMEIPIYDRNQGEIARTHSAITQANELQSAASETVMTDVANAYQTTKVNDQIIQLYISGYLQQAQDSRDISEYAYKRGAASLLDFLDAERSFRATQLAYRQALANYMLAVEQLKGAVGTRNLP